jgi:predicted Rossmann fold nucleotide-binding protein DprA/Smf involved in DNA uptake
MVDHTIPVDTASIHYPARLRELSLHERYPRLWMVGDPDLLGLPLLGLLCSTRCPGQVILHTYDLARALRKAGVPVISGFQSPMEKECLELLLRGTQPVVICPARSIECMRFPASWRVGLDAQRCLVVSPFTKIHRRVTSELAEERNNLVAALAKQVVVLHAQPGGRIDRLCRKLMAEGKTIWTLDLPDNDAIVGAGARPGTPEALVQILQ